MGAPQYEQAGADIGGTGTTNTIPRWTGPSTLGDSAITDNGTVVAFGRNINATSTAGGASYVLTPSAGGQVFGQTVASSVWYLGRTTGAGAAVQTDVCINNSGNVGIGTASPRAIVDIVGAAASTPKTKFGEKVDASTNYATAFVGVTRDTASGYKGALIFATGDNGDNATERARITSAGRFGLGTTSPISLMHINDPGANATYYTAGNTNNGMLFGVAASGQNLLMNYAASSIIVGAYNGGTPTQWINITSTSLDASAIAGYGLKLPATPGNADTQTLDAYREDTFTTSFSGLGNCSSVSASNLRFTQIGRLVTIEGTFTFTVTAATTQTNFNFTLPSGRNRGSTANAGCGIGVDNASTFTGAIWNASGDATTAAIYFGPTNPFGAGTVRTVPFSYSYYTAT